jgi:hypothetical protein
VTVSFNHTIVAARDAKTSAFWLADLFGFDPPTQYAHFWQVSTANDVGLDFDSLGDRDLTPQHYAFLVGESEFDVIYGRIVERGIDHWADPMQSHPGEINHQDGGRGVYFLSNDGHSLEIITRPYGSGS